MSHNDLPLSTAGDMSKKPADNPPDVVLLCGPERISCHKAVLSKESHYFNAMFNNGFAESGERYITIKDVDGFLLRLCIDLSYGYPIELQSEEMTMNLLETAAMLQFSAIQQKCAKMLLQSLSNQNVLQIYALAELTGTYELTKQAFAYILYNFDSLSSSNDKFTDLPLNTLIKILGHSNLNCKSEVEILQIANHWIAKQEETITEDDIINLISCARFQKFNSTQLKAISNLPIIHSSDLLSKVVATLITKLDSTELKSCRCVCHESPAASLKVSSCQTCREGAQSSMSEKDSDSSQELLEHEPSCCAKASGCLFPCRRLLRKKPVQLAAQDRITFSRGACHPPEILRLCDRLLNSAPRAPPFAACVVAHVRSPDVLAGEGPSVKKLKQSDGPCLLLFDMTSHSFQNLVQLAKVHEGPLEASGYKVCSLGKSVYIFGGEYMLGYSNWQNSVWRWDSFKNFWSIETSLPSQRRHHSVCVHEHFIYLIGGYGRHRIILDSVERYDTLKSSWKKCAPLPSPAYSVACCSYRGLIYVFSHQIFTYDPDVDEWQTLTNVSIPGDTSFSQALSVENEGIYLTSIYSNLLYYFCPASDDNLEVKIVGEFRNNILNSCYVDTRKTIFTFSTADLSESASGGYPSANHHVEIYDLEKKTFSIIWKQQANEGFVTDFGIRHSMGCFSFLHYE